MQETQLSSESRRRIARHIDDLGSDVETLAIAAERHLIRYGARAVDALIAATGDSNAQVRFRAVYALGKIGDTRATDCLTACAQDNDPRVAHDAVVSLAELANPQAGTPLLELIDAADKEAKAEAADRVIAPREPSDKL